MPAAADRARQRDLRRRPGAGRADVAALGLLRAARERRRPLRAVPLARHKPGGRRHERPRGHLPARPRRRRRRPVRRAGPDRDAPALGAERRLRRDLPGAGAGGLRHAAHRDGLQPRRAPRGVRQRARVRPGRRQRPVGRVRDRHRARPHDPPEPAARRRAGCRRGANAGHQRRRPVRRVPNLRCRHGLLRHQRRRRRLRRRSRPRRQRGVRRAGPDVHAHQPAAWRRALHHAVPAGRRQRRRALGRLFVAVDAGHLRSVDRPQRAGAHGRHAGRRHRTVLARRALSLDGRLRQRLDVHPHRPRRRRRRHPGRSRQRRRRAAGADPLGRQSRHDRRGGAPGSRDGAPVRRRPRRARSGRARPAAVRFGRRRAGRRLRVALRPERGVGRGRRRLERRPRRRRTDQRPGAAGGDASPRLPDAVSRRGCDRLVLLDADRRRQSRCHAVARAPALPDRHRTDDLVAAVDPAAVASLRLRQQRAEPRVGVVLDRHRGRRAHRRRSDDALDLRLLRLDRRDQRRQPVADVVPGRRRDAR